MTFDELTKHNDRYVLAVQYDGANQPNEAPIVFEQYLHSATFEEVKKFQQRIGDRYGKTKIARLQFMEEE